MPSPRPRFALSATLGAAVLGGLALAAAPAQAQVGMRPLKPCYVSANFLQREHVRVAASGFAANAVVDRVIDGQPATPVDANAGGVVRFKWDPFQKRGERTATITLTERDNPLNTITATTRVTALSVTVHPRRAATSRRVRFRGRGFTKQKAIWGHYVFHDRVRKTVRFAQHPHGECGKFSVRRRQIPILRPRPGKWTLQVDQQKHWSPRPDSVFVPVPITVERIIGG
jgi:hypothetical protein